MGATTAIRGLFDHRALPYHDRDELLESVAPFVREGAEVGDPVVVILPAETLAALLPLLGPAAVAPHVRLIEAEAAARNPGALLATWQEFTDDLHHRARPGRAVAETFRVDRSEAELAECLHYEAQLNLAFFSTSAIWTLLCPVDVSTLDMRSLEAAIRAHPHLHLDGRSRPNVSYVHPGTAAALEPAPLEPAPDGATSVEFDPSTIGAARRRVGELATAGGLDDDRAADLVLAVGELGANSIVHGGGAGVVRMWTTPDAVVCDVVDHGWIADPLAGTRRPAATADRGRGLWLVHALCDLVQVRSDPHGTMVRVVMHRAAPPSSAHPAGGAA